MPSLLDRVTRRRPVSRSMHWPPSWAPPGAQVQPWRQTTWGPVEGPIVDNCGQALSGESGVVFGVLAIRAGLLSEVRFVWRRRGAGPRATAADVFEDERLGPLMSPRRLLYRAELDVAQYGNAFMVRDGARVVCLPPQWVTMALSSSAAPDDPGQAWDAHLEGIVYAPPGVEPTVFFPGQFAHWAPYQDPGARFRGMSWLRPVLTEVGVDGQTTRFVRAFFENGATPNLWIKYPEDVKLDVVRKARELFNEGHAGAGNAFRTAWLAGGGDPKIIGSDLKSIDVQATKASMHAEVCVAAGVPDIIVGTQSAGDKSTYSNYAESKRRLADVTMRPLWGSIAEALRQLFPGDGDSELWYDASGVAFLQADAIDDAQVLTQQATAIGVLITQGWDPESAQAAVTSGDLGKLVHSGMMSVQLQSPQTDGDAMAERSRKVYLAVGKAITPNDAREMIGLPPTSEDLSIYLPPQQQAPVGGEE